MIVGVGVQSLLQPRPIEPKRMAPEKELSCRRSPPVFSGLPCRPSDNEGVQNGHACLAYRQRASVVTAGKSLTEFTVPLIPKPRHWAFFRE
jgi:hypothetical protein